MPAHATALIRGLLLLLVLCVVAVPLADAHGYVNVPQSRAYKCNLSKASRCGPVMYEPQSVEGPKGFPSAGPANGQLMGAGRFPDLDPQVPSWPTNAARAGSTTFQWYLTAAHKTTSFRYFITKQGWDSTKPLTRNALDLTPFCTVNGNGAVPASTVTHQCNVPSRSGYHVVLAVWDIADTGNAFYQGIDMQF